MGADFLLACLPAASISTERRQRLHEMVENLSDEDIQNDYLEILGEEGPEEARKALCRHIDLLPEESQYRRDVSELDLPGLGFPMRFTGGMSCGDVPTDLYDTFCALAECGPITNNWSSGHGRTSRRWPSRLRPSKECENAYAT